ncbi:cysteine--1-D-myo-inosityl 2-amino-2-deoxy-alpha-D-glucopyranoside ligase [Pengzhenrongella frigida]|uniref:L-cysteine:1D-myo-inositol 2-amino-2-deoxy-alpha-D-glucopyranoside ligase n=1 Tax=Pengzhenrongella frigida TaxID=1259133 RepID=A0A4Q5N3A8_9MICO|nr:cysteine--1-D-myo-inosityl 2-amino-2-deoxy-alpha-D-glucopyranoside ligase [Cellulomonas sp. HLT2-17]RYV52670.1 cysteine--1-D-myo-inosityl 2-amino-2-deoxy-alpha-D-glucopyranoside ligase [Cellulomonas sp. HLT2-17]
MHTWPAPQIPQLPGTGPEIRVRDTSSGELVVAATGPTATMFVCGITPYDATHLGHAATYIAFDLLLRAWRDAGHAVRYASNVTDVDDPLLERATATGVDWRDLAADQTALFTQDMTALGVVPPDVFVGAVESIPDVVLAVEQMLRRGSAYRVPNEPGAGGADPELGDVYADRSVDTEFGSVARLDRAEMLAVFAERGGDPDRPGKRDPLDSLLWRRERPGEPAWDGSTLGTGRPGWHIECAVIARDGLGLPFDVQGGGVDLRFPHHEMSTSHARMLDGGLGSRFHVHAGMVGLDGEKMSKSRGNLVLVSQLRAEGNDPMAIRLAILAHHYAGDWEWTPADLVAGAARLELWRSAVSGNGGPVADVTLAQMRSALADDLDAPTAIAAVDAWAELALAGAPGGWDVTDHAIDGAPGVIARAVNALLGVRL